MHVHKQKIIKLDGIITMSHWVKVPVRIGSVTGPTPKHHRRNKMKKL
jgi:hypothetical protein